MSKNKNKSSKNNKKFEGEQNLNILSHTVGSDDSVDIKDCGFSAESVYYYPNHAKKFGMIPRAKDGGWIPVVTIYRQKYLKCKMIKENTGAPHFNDGFDNSFR